MWYGNDFAKIYGKTITDTFVSDDGIGIYYNADVLTNIDTYFDVPIILNNDGWIKCTFKKLLETILSDAGSVTYPFIVMDSNNSIYYEKKYDLPETTSSLIRKHGFSDSVPKTGYECFKMRHNMGNQPKKYCLLMFDTIDKILYRPPNKYIPRLYIRDEFDFLKYDMKNYDIINNIRTNDIERSKFENFCNNSPKTTDSMVMFRDIQILIKKHVQIIHQSYLHLLSVIWFNYFVLLYIMRNNERKEK